MGHINDQQTTTHPVPYADTMRLHRAIRDCEYVQARYAHGTVECELAPELRVGYTGDGTSFRAWQRLYLRLLVNVS